MSILLLIATVIQPLWPSLEKMPDYRPEQIAAPREIAAKPGFDKAAHRMPYLEWCDAPDAKVKKDVCMILISGGGYNNTCDGPAFKPFEERLRKEGITCVYLWYRTPRPKGLPIYRTAWEDGQRAVRLVRAAAKERGFDPEKIGVMGCSAGSHLSVLLATSSQTKTYDKLDLTDDIPCHINWAIPHCPAYVLADGLDCPNKNKGEGAKLDTLFRFDEKTCPMCLLHGGEDPYSPLGSTQIYRQLRRMKIPAELHLDASRKHGVCKIADFERAIEFMRQMGYLGKLAPEVDIVRTNEDNGRIKTWKEYVWPEGKMPNAQAKQCIPYIEWYIPEKTTTKSIQIIYSGGSYMGNSPDQFEVAPFRRYLMKKGMTCVTLKYRCPRPDGLPKHLTAWQDLQRVVRIVRTRAPSMGLDPNCIGIMGSSAGGHLTLMGALSSGTRAYAPIDDLDFVPCNVNWGVAIYPAYALTDGAEKPNVKGGNEDDAVLVPEFKFDEGTCPLVFIHGDIDCWAAMNSVKCWEKLRTMGIQCDLHTLAKRPHCFQSKSSPGTGSFTWMDRIWSFMTKKQINGTALKSGKAATVKPANETASKTAKKTTFAYDALKPYVDSGELPGAINIFYKNGVEEICCIGYADTRTKREITLDDPYMQCSQTKGFCGVTIAKLVEEGKISLDDPVSKYLPEFKTLWIGGPESNGVRVLTKAKNVLTVRMCLNHTGGFPFETSVKQPNIKHGGWSGGCPIRQTAACAAASPILFEPGTNSRYSNTGIDIGAAVVEVVTGKRWEDYLQEEVLTPLGMKNTGFWPSDQLLAHQIEMYDCQKGAPAVWRLQNDQEQRPYNDRSRIFASAGAGLWTTARDQVKFYKMLMNLGVGENGVRILKEETVKSILATSTCPATLKDNAYSLGLRAPLKDNENEWFGHGGAWGTNCMVNWHKKELKLWVVQLCGGPRPWDAERAKAAEAFFKHVIDNSGADAYTGRVK